MWLCPFVQQTIGPCPPDWFPTDDCYWLRGLTPAPWTCRPLSDSATWHGTGLWTAKSSLPTTNLAFGNGSGPYSTSARHRVVAWAVVAYDIDTWQEVATMYGSVEDQQTVPRAEAKAFEMLLEHTTGPIHLAATDSSSTCRRFSKVKQAITRPSQSNLTIWSSIYQHSKGRHVKLTWTRAHLTEEEHRTEFGEDAHWMWVVNRAAEKLANTHAQDLANEHNLSQQSLQSEWIDPSMLANPDQAHPYSPTLAPGW